jgi:hypothetical protein
VEDDGAAAGPAGLAPYAPVGRYAGEEDDHAVGADVGLGVCVAEGERVSGFGEELVG